jgi:tetratricopeptide (TPR) repeat protein
VHPTSLAKTRATARRHLAHTAPKWRSGTGNDSDVAKRDDADHLPWSTDAMFPCRSLFESACGSSGCTQRRLVDTAPAALLRNAIALATAGKFTEADAAYKAALAAAQDLQGSEGLLVADVLFWQASFLRDRLRRYDEAWSAAERALLIYQKKLGESNPRTALTEGLLGSIALWLRLPGKAEPHFRAVVDAYNAIGTNTGSRKSF